MDVWIGGRQSHFVDLIFRNSIQMMMDNDVENVVVVVVVDYQQ